MIALGLMAASLSCVRYARFQGFSSQTGTCEGACRHYVSCKDDERPEAFRGCMSDCGEIFVYDGEADRDSLRAFEGLECSDAIAFVDGDEDGRDRTATRRAPARVRSQAQ
jgi:hypothetical protein